MKKIIVNAIIVTYNRKHLLEKTLTSLYKQSYPISKIVVVDNCSTDKTWDYLTKLSKKHKNLQLIKNKDNLGMASAVNLALKTIWDEKWDAVWISDDDNIASATALEELIKYYDENTIFNSILLDFKNKNKLTFPKTDLETGKVYFELKQLINNRKMIINNSIAFNFTLISKNIFKIINFLDDQYFIRGDEIDFITRALLKNINLKIIVNSQVFCLNQRNIKKIKILNMKINREMINHFKNYYNVRNTLFLLKKYQKKIFHHPKKNSIFNFYPCYKYPLPIFMFLYSIYSVILALIFYKKNQLKIIYSAFLAYYHFIINKRGKIQL